MSIASMTLIEFDWNFGYSSKDGWWAEWPTIPSHLLDTKMVQFIAVDVPGIGGSLNRTQMVNNPHETVDTYFNVHSGYFGVLNGEHHFESGQDGLTNVSVGGGARAIVGVDGSFGLKLR